LREKWWAKHSWRYRVRNASWNLAISGFKRNRKSDTAENYLAKIFALRMGLMAEKGWIIICAKADRGWTMMFSFWQAFI
jgi:hypothetical protein